MWAMNNLEVVLIKYWNEKKKQSDSVQQDHLC